MKCSMAAELGYCDYRTTLGHVGLDLCRRSCGTCPMNPPPTPKETTLFGFPRPKKAHGSKSHGGKEKPVTTWKGETEAEWAEKQEGKEEVDQEDPFCVDDVVWRDSDGDGCEVYGSYIKNGQMSRHEACAYNDHAAKVHCRKTCRTCKVKSSTCEDKECVASWRLRYGKCFVCSDWPAYCGEPSFRADCPRTCGTCTPMGPPSSSSPWPVLPLNQMSTLSTTTTSPAPVAMQCEDSECIVAWLQTTGKCHKCRDFGEEFCGRDADFMKSCPKTCRRCLPQEDPVCVDDFRPHTCKRYVAWGWCSVSHLATHCRSSCGLCQAATTTKRKEELRSGAAGRFSVGMTCFFAIMALLF